MIPLLTLIGAGTYGSKGPFWTLSSEWLGAASAAAGLAPINALGNLSGFIFNYTQLTREPECGINDAEVVGDLVTVDMPVPRHLLAQKS